MPSMVALLSECAGIMGARWSLVQSIVIINTIVLIYWNPLNLRDLQYLVTLAETRHFGRAARKCHVSQPTLSAQLKKLEESH
jgi:DNA-binding HxlR family transcriptional regulator